MHYHQGAAIAAAVAAAVAAAAAAAAAAASWSLWSSCFVVVVSGMFAADDD